MKHVGGVVYYIGVIIVSAMTYIYCVLTLCTLRITLVMAFMLGYEAEKRETSDFIFTLPWLKKFPKHAKEYYKEYHE